MKNIQYFYQILTTKQNKPKKNCLKTVKQKAKLKFDSDDSEKAAHFTNKTSLHIKLHSLTRKIRKTDELEMKNQLL